MPELQRYIVEGAYANGNEGFPVTSDLVVAASADQATAIVEKVRQRSDEWFHSTTETFEEYVESSRRFCERLLAMTPEQVEQGWAETKASLGLDEEEDESDG